MSVQRELTANTTLELAYVGSHIVHVGIPDTNLNQLTVDQLAMGAPLLKRVPNPYFGEIPRSSSLGDPTITVAQLTKPYPEYTTVSLYRNNVGTTRYDGFQVGLRQRLSRGLSYTVAYTRSVLKDDASSVFDASILTGPVANYPVADSFNRTLERDYSTGDIPHVFVASAVWDLPAGAGRAHQLHGWLGALANDWTMTGLVTLQSGVPIAITQTTNFNAFAGFGVQRPNLVGDPTLPSGERSPTPVVRHVGVCCGAAIHDRIGIEESRARAVVSRRRSRADAANPHRRRQTDRAARGGLQSAQHAAARRARSGSGRGELRRDYQRGRSARGSARSQVQLLIPLSCVAMSSRATTAGLARAQPSPDVGVRLATSSRVMTVAG